MTEKQVNLKAAIGRELDRHTVATLATNGAGGPHAVSLMYAHDEDLSIYWVSDPTTRHSSDLADGADAAVTIAGQFDDFRAIHGLQMRGLAHVLSDKNEHDRGLELLGNRFAFLKLFQAGPKKLMDRFARVKVYRFTPHRITLTDNSKGFGHKDVLNLSAGN